MTEPVVPVTHCYRCGAETTMYYPTFRWGPTCSEVLNGHDYSVAAKWKCPFCQVEMSCFGGDGREVGLWWMCPRGVAPARMLKAEATTGLSPKKASATDPLVTAEKSPSEGLAFNAPWFDLALFDLAFSGVPRT
jgi:hypothetical protein